MNIYSNTCIVESHCFGNKLLHYFIISNKMHILYTEPILYFCAVITLQSTKPHYNLLIWDFFIKPEIIVIRKYSQGTKWFGLMRLVSSPTVYKVGFGLHDTWASDVKALLVMQFLMFLSLFLAAKFNVVFIRFSMNRHLFSVAFFGFPGFCGVAH